MGATFEVYCRDCKVKRDLDKFTSMRFGADTRKEVLEIAEDIHRTDSFRAALLVTFMWAHKGHNCSVFCDEDWPDEVDDTYKTESYYWQ